MKEHSFKNLVGTVALLFVFCSVAEAGPSASKVYKVSVTIPATFQTQATAEQGIGTNSKNMQIAMEEDVRDNEMVMIQTVVAK